MKGIVARTRTRIHAISATEVLQADGNGDVICADYNNST